jgi:hypothetical protein
LAGNKLSRKQLIATLGSAGIAACTCAAVGDMREAFGAEPRPQPVSPASPPPARPGDQTMARAAKRMEFVDGWVRRFLDVMDQNLDEPARRKLMAANGRACFSAYDKEGRRRPEPASLERIAAWVEQNGKARGYSMEGNVISFEYVGSAETGEASPEGVCLCPTVEAQTAGRMSATYCHCSVGYVAEMHERTFGRPVQVQLVDSVLLGATRCKFRITVA